MAIGTTTDVIGQGLVEDDILAVVSHGLITGEEDTADPDVVTGTWGD